MSLPPPAQQLVDGKLVGAADGSTYPVLNPATGQEIGVAPDATAGDLEAAIAAARRAFDESDWSTDTGLRVRCLAAPRKTPGAGEWEYSSRKWCSTSQA